VQGRERAAKTTPLGRASGAVVAAWKEPPLSVRFVDVRPRLWIAPRGGKLSPAALVCALASGVCYSG